MNVMLLDLCACMLVCFNMCSCVYECVWVCACLCLFCWRKLCLCVLQQWYTSTMNLLGTWLTDRMDLQLHVYQLKILIRVVKVRQGWSSGTFNQGSPKLLEAVILLKPVTLSYSMIHLKPVHVRCLTPNKQDKCFSKLVLLLSIKVYLFFFFFGVRDTLRGIH